MALIHRWPLVPSLNGGDVTLDIVGGLTTTNVGSMTQSETDGIQCLANYSKRIECNKSLGNAFTHSFWVKYSSTITADYDDPTGVGNGPSGIFIYKSGSAYFGLDGLAVSYVLMTTAQKTLLLDGGWHLTTVRLSSGTLTGGIDSLFVSVTGSAPSKTLISLGGSVTGSGSIAKLKDHRIYNSGLSDSDIAAMVIAGPNPVTNPQYSYAI